MQANLYRERHAEPINVRARLLWTLGNALMLIGIVLILYVGGVYTQAEYERYAARGDTEVPAARPAAEDTSEEPAPFTAPMLNASAPAASASDASASEGQVVGAIPDAARADHQSTVSRVVIPSIGVDSKVVEVGWDVKEQNGQQ